MSATSVLYLFAAIGLSAASGATQAEDGSFHDIPYRNPALLQELLSLEEGQFHDVVARDWGRLREAIDQYLPPQLVPARLPRSFAGPRDSCLRYRLPSACRVHLSDLLRIHQNREQRGLILSNPFANKD